MRVVLPEFTNSRFSPCYNLMDEDRLKWYNWNLACIALTAVPLRSDVHGQLPDLGRHRRPHPLLEPHGHREVKYDLRLYGS